MSETGALVAGFVVLVSCGAWACNAESTSTSSSSSTSPSIFASTSTSSSNPDPTRPACWANGDGCVCGEERPDSAADFPGTCDENSVGDRGSCCQGSDDCYCSAIYCGIDRVDGLCLCGFPVSPETHIIVDSCTATASMCCTQDTGYCYCEDECINRFANRTVGSCDLTTSTVVCYEDEVQVASCE